MLFFKYSFKQIIIVGFGFCCINVKIKKLTKLLVTNGFVKTFNKVG